MKMFSIRDLKAEAFNEPFFNLTPAMAMRRIQMSLQSPESQMKIFAPDFAIYQIGEFDQVTGLVTGIPDPHHLIEIVDLIKDIPSAHPSTTIPS